MSDNQIKLSAAYNTVASSLRHLLLRLNSIESIEEGKKQMLHDIQLTNTYIYRHAPSLPYFVLYICERELAGIHTSARVRTKPKLTKLSYC